MSYVMLCPNCEDELLEDVFPGRRSNILAFCEPDLKVLVCDTCRAVYGCSEDSSQLVLEPVAVAVDVQMRCVAGECDEDDESIQNPGVGASDISLWLPEAEEVETGEYDADPGVWELLAEISAESAAA